MDRNHRNLNLVKAATNLLEAKRIGFRRFIRTSKSMLGRKFGKWQISLLTAILKHNKGIRFNIFQLNQTYLGTDARLNIGPKGFTGEKYGGSTYWDTEAYCIPFYMATKDQK